MRLSYHDAVDATAEAEAVAIERLSELTGRPTYAETEPAGTRQGTQVGVPALCRRYRLTPTTRLQHKQLEHIAYQLRLQAAAAGEWRMEPIARCGRYQRVCFGSTARAQRPGDAAHTTRAAREHRNARLTRERLAKAHAVAASAAALLSLADAAALAGFHVRSLEKAVGKGRLAAHRGAAGTTVRPADVAEYIRLHSR